MEPSLFKSILAAIPAFVLFVLVTFVATFVFGLLLVFLASLPIIRNILGFIISARGDGVDWCVFASCALAMVCALWVCRKIAKEDGGRLAAQITGGSVVVYYAYVGVSSLISGNGMLMGLAGVIFGVITAVYGNKD